MQTYHILIDASQKETTRHGSFEFPLAIYTTQISKNILGFIDWHWHEELQFALVTSGIVAFSIQSETLLLKEGEGLFINKDQLHKAVNHFGHDSSFICFDFHPNMISSFMGSLINHKYISPYVDNPHLSYCILKPNLPWQEGVLEKLKKVYAFYTAEEQGYELEIFIVLLEIWKSLVQNHFEEIKLSSANEKDPMDLKKVMDYIHHHYKEKIELSDLASQLNLSKSTFCRKFKNQMHCTVFDYLINYRLSQAANLLLSTNDSVADIAYHCGFGSTSYFIEKFRLRTNVSPLNYRKLNVRESR